jgi:hypothetical protein
MIRKRHNHEQRRKHWIAPGLTSLTISNWTLVRLERTAIASSEGALLELSIALQANVPE